MAPFSDQADSWACAFSRGASATKGVGDGPKLPEDCQNPSNFFLHLYLMFEPLCQSFPAANASLGKSLVRVW